VENSVLAEAPPKSPGLFANRNFLLLFTGRLISKLGDSIYLFALTWYTFEKYSSPMLAGIMMMLGTVPTILLGPFGGVIADKLDRKKIIVLMEFVRAGVILTIAVMEYYHRLHIWFLFLAAVILDVCGAFFNPACIALVPNIVGKANLTAANSAETMTTNISNILGILGGGLFYATMGFATISLLNAVSFVAAGSLEMMVALPPKKTLPVLRPESNLGRRSLQLLTICSKVINFYVHRPGCISYFSLRRFLTFYLRLFT
jgi:DHA3 family macrolide efflux protein-like MFS transporter